MAVLDGTPMAAAIRARYVAGAVVGGTSAGAAVMSTPMITGDERAPGGARRDTTQNFITIARDDIVLTNGLGLLEGAIVDQHFLRRRRHSRLISVVLEHPSMLAIGIDESTALVVEPGKPWSIIGESAAIVYDARRARSPQRRLRFSGQPICACLFRPRGAPSIPAQTPRICLDSWRPERSDGSACRWRSKQISLVWKQQPIACRRAEASRGQSQIPLLIGPEESSLRSDSLAKFE